MEKRELGPVIAEREPEGQWNGKQCRVVVRFGKPFLDKSEGSPCWYCPYSIVAPTRKRLFYGAGLDSLQAFRIAVSMVGSELAALYSDLKLKWCGEEDLGFGPGV